MKMKRGFSLIEIGIVMVVIGLIIAAVMKGKDVIKNAEVKEINQNFMAKWVNVADTFYDKVGYNLTGQNKSFTYMSRADGTQEDNCTALLDQLGNEAGIKLEKLVKTNTDSYCQARLAGEFTDEVTVSVGFVSAYVDAPNEGNLTRNLVVFNNVPTDVAIALDKLLDGTIDGERGKALNFRVNGVSGDGTTTDYKGYSYRSPTTVLIDSDSIGTGPSSITTGITLADGIEQNSSVRAIEFPNAQRRDLHIIGIVLEH